MAFPKKKKSDADDHVVINAPNMKILAVGIRGLTPYVFNKFSSEAENQMREKQEKGSQDKARGSAKKLPPKDFHKQFLGSLHVAETDGWYGIPVIAIRASCVRSASLCGVEMTRAKQCLFVIPDGYTADGQGLVRILKGEPEQFVAPVRNAGGGPDIRARGRLAPGWEARVMLQFDEDFMSASSAVNLLARAGLQTGIGAGRPFSKMSVGMGWGTFEIIREGSEKAAAE